MGRGSRCVGRENRDWGLETGENSSRYDLQNRTWVSKYNFDGYCFPKSEFGKERESRNLGKSFFSLVNLSRNNVPLWPL